MSKKKIIDAVQAQYPNLTKKEVGQIIDSTFNTISTQLNVKGDKYTPKLARGRLRPETVAWVLAHRILVDQDQDRSFGICWFQACYGPQR